MLAVVLAVGINQAKPLLAKIRYQKTVGEVSDFAVEFRLSNWKDTARIAFDFSAVGIGAGGFREFFPLYKTMPEHGIHSQKNFQNAENDMLEGFAETGFVGMGLLLFFALLLTKRFLRVGFLKKAKPFTGYLSASCAVA